MTLYNDILVPSYLCINKTRLTEAADNTANRKAEVWGTVRVNHPEDEEYHLQNEEDRE